MTLILVTAWGPAEAGPRDTVLLISMNDRSTYELNPDTGALGRRIANGHHGVISPDRTRAAYVRDTTPCTLVPSEECRVDMDLLTADLTGADEQVVVETGDQDGVNRSNPDWAPDGSRILFTWSGLPGEGRGLAWVRPDGSDLETLVFNARLGTFSPDGKKIAYIDSNSSDVYVMDVASRATRALTTDGSAVSNSPPTWSPDGKRITYTGPFALYVLDVKTGASINLAARLSPAIVGYSTPVFSPDGREIAFAGVQDPDGSPTLHIFAISLAGGEPRVVSDQFGTLTDWLRL
jgi:Tol biopolymer transport system component